MDLISLFFVNIRDDSRVYTHCCYVPILTLTHICYSYLFIHQVINLNTKSHLSWKQNANIIFLVIKYFTNEPVSIRYSEFHPLPPKKLLFDTWFILEDMANISYLIRIFSAVWNITLILIAYIHYLKLLVDVERSPRVREIRVRSPVATDLSR